MRKVLISLPSVLLAVILLLSTASPVLAIADPDSPPSINAVYVYENSLEPGDLGILIDYFLDYAATPTEPVTDAYLAVFVDTDGSTQLKAIAPYTFDTNGYGRGQVWIRFSAAEVTLYGLAYANRADYRIWLTGNPTLLWPSDPPKTITGIDQWTTVSDPSTLLALRVLYFADLLELAWGEDLVESTALGNRLTTTGESYYENVIADLRTMAPNAFSVGSVDPALEDIDYSTEFGGTATGAIVAGTPVTLTSGANTITATGTGTFIITLEVGTEGTIADAGGSISVSPSNIVAGDNTIVVTGAGTLTVTVELVNTQTVLTDDVEGTGFDLTDVATAFGTSRLMFSGILWIVISIIICAAVYRQVSKGQSYGQTTSGQGNAVMLVFFICLVGGTLLGLLDMRVAAMLVISMAAYFGYVVFFRGSADIGRTVMFMGWMWFVVCLVGGTMVGTVAQASTRLTADITATDDTITVSSTAGFKAPGFIIIGDERITFSKTTATEFTETTFRQMVRGAQGTTAAAHSTGASVRSVTSALLNNSLNYNIALLTDASGIMSFVSLPIVLWDVIMSFVFLPFAFMGTDMVILTYVWAIFALGLIVSFFIMLVGGRKMT